jgi:hypothetical protein
MAMECWFAASCWLPVKIAFPLLVVFRWVAARFCLCGATGGVAAATSAEENAQQTRGVSLVLAERGL